jgi:hypothetical protein
MGDPLPPVVRCSWCLKRMSPADDACPHCGRPVETDDFRPLGGGAEPVPGVTGDEETAAELTPLGGEAEDAAADAPGQETDRSAPAARKPVTERTRPPPSELDGVYRPQPLEPAPGQEPETSWEYIRGIARADKLFAAVLAILALELLVSLLSCSVIGVIISGAVFWGVLSLQWWGYWLAIILSLLGLLWALVGLAIGMVSAIQTGTIGLLFIYPAISAAGHVFILLVLFTRRQHFG